MLPSFKKIALLICIFSAGFGYNLSYADAAANDKPAGRQNNSLPVFYLGKASASVTMYEFVSAGCPHCANNFKFITTTLKTKFINTGKLKVILVPLPIFGDTDVKALSMWYFSKNNEQFFKLVELFFNNQRNIFLAGNPQETIITYAKLAGVSEDTIKKYRSDTNIGTTIKKDAEMYAKKYKITVTPVSVIVKSNHPITKNSVKIEGDGVDQELIAAIQKMLNKSS